MRARQIPSGPQIPSGSADGEITFKLRFEKKKERKKAYRLTSPYRVSTMEPATKTDGWMGGWMGGWVEVWIHQKQPASRATPDSSSPSLRPTFGRVEQSNGSREARVYRQHRTRYACLRLSDPSGIKAPTDRSRQRKQKKLRFVPRWTQEEEQRQKNTGWFYWARLANSVEACFTSYLSCNLRNLKTTLLHGLKERMRNLENPERTQQTQAGIRTDNHLAVRAAA